MTSSPSSLPLADALDETPVADEGLEQDLDLHRAEPEPEGALAARGDVVHHLAERAARHRAGVDRRVRGDGSPPGAAEQLVHGPAELPADQVVQRHVHGGERMDAQPAPAVVHGALAELGGGPDLERVAAEQHAAQAAAPGVDVVHQHQLTDRRRGCVGLPHPDLALLVPDRTRTVSLDPSRSAPSFDWPAGRRPRRPRSSRRSRDHCPGGQPVADRLTRLDQRA